MLPLIALLLATVAPPQAPGLWGTAVPYNRVDESNMDRWVIARKADPMTDVSVLTIMHLDTERQTALAITCREQYPNRLMVNVKLKENIASKFGETALLVRYDDDQVDHDTWELDKENLLSVEHPPHLKKVLARLIAAKRLRIRAPLVGGGTVDYEFALGDLKGAMPPIERACPTKPE